MHKLINVQLQKIYKFYWIGPWFFLILLGRQKNPQKGLLMSSERYFFGFHLRIAIIYIFDLLELLLSTSKVSNTRPASTSKYCKLYLRLRPKTLFKSYCGLQRHFFSLCSPQALFSSKMWPLHRFEFETLDILGLGFSRKKRQSWCIVKMQNSFHLNEV